MKKYIVLILLSALTIAGYAQQKKYTLSGEMKDAKTGEELVGASVYVEELKTGVTTNSYGFYSLSLPSGSYTIVFSYIGYESVKKQVDLSSNQRIKMEFKEAYKQLK
jgi:hypothetical protein